MKISVIIPIYNVGKYLCECVDSILKQTFTDFELILVDDGSTDHSGDLCDEYAARDKRVVAVHQKNAGQAAARNEGAKLAKGDYLVYMDSDDYLLGDDLYRKLAKVIDETGADIVFFKHKKFFDDTKEFSSYSYSYKNAIAADGYTSSIAALVVDDAFFGMAWNKAVKRSVMVDNKIFFPEGKVGEDMDWMLRLCLKATSTAFIDEPFIAYRQRAGSITATVKIKNLKDFVEIVKARADEINAVEDNDMLKNALLSATAKYYCNLLITYNRVADKQKKEYKKTIKELAWLLDYGVSRRPIIVRRAYKMLGFNLMLTMLSALDKIKRQ